MSILNAIEKEAETVLAPLLVSHIIGTSPLVKAMVTNQTKAFYFEAQLVKQDGIASKIKTEAEALLGMTDADFALPA